MISKPQTWDNINENGGNRKLPMGAYVCIIHKVTDVADKQYLQIDYDIAEGVYKGIALDNYEAWGNWNHSFRVYYTDKAMWRLKKFITRVEKTNANFTFNWSKPECLVNKGIGLIIGIRQYYSSKDGSLKDALDVQDFCTAAEVREGNLPSEPRTVAPKNPPPMPVMETVSDEEYDSSQLPF